MDAEPLTHISLTVDDDGVALVLLDRADASMNTLGPELAGDLARVLDRLETDDAIRAVVLGSGKPASFVAGADVYYLATLESGEQAVEVLTEAHRAFLRLELLHAHRGKPVVAAIHGPALGGGLELALACSARVASDDARTQLGQPEVQLGLIPGAGGTQRLPRLVGLERGLEMITSGRALRPAKALAAGLVDEVVTEDELLSAARTRALASIGRPRRVRKTGFDVASLRRRALESGPGRRFVFAQAEKQIAARTKGNYPAPLAALRAVRAGYEHGIQAGYQAELAGFAALIESPEAAALMSIFFATQSLKDDPGIDTDAEPRPMEEIGVVGGGLMGGGIATVSVLRARRRTRIKEVDDAAVARGIGYVEKVLATRRERGRLDADEQERLLGMLSGSTSWDGFASTDLFIEAVFEDLDLKRTVLSQAEEAAPEAIFASNTSSLPIADIAAGAARPEMVIGMHYFSPVEKMPLLEVIVTAATADWVTATCVEEGKRQGKHVIVVRDGPGFYTSRILAPYMIEVGRLLEEGVPIEDVDRAMVRWGFPVGPVTLTDEVGIDVGAKIAVIMQDAFGERLTPPALFRTLVEDGRKGRKNGRGFYRYEDGEKKGVDETVYEVLGITPDHPIPAEEIQERLALHMVNEAARCLEEGILRSARDGDVGAVFGLAFPPFRGGPFFWVDQVGASAVVERLDRLAARHGPRYEPAAILRERAESGTPFRPGAG